MTLPTFRAYIKRLGISPLEFMDTAQDHGWVSDNAVTLDDVARVDLAKVVATRVLERRES